MKIYQLKITLKNISPTIWRRVEVQSDINLDDLSRVILNVMGWYGGHLMIFEIGRREFYFDKESAHQFDGILMSKARLNKYLTAPKDKAKFTYDFGDDWQHNVVLEKILDPEPGATYPRCTAGKRKCPPEDCGGPWAYAGILEALKDPDKTKNKELLEWVGDDYDPEAFSVEWANGRMERTIINDLL
ncbi:MAG: plasmid pRiA4b ORF-3 family protein [Saprospiraceae bacterium]